MASFGSAPSLIVAAGVGAAAATALEPAFEVPRQEAWKRNQNRVLEPRLLARLVAAGGIELGEAQDEAARQGYYTDKFDRMVWLEQHAPDVAELLELWRRGKIGVELVDLGLAKAQIDPRYWTPLKELFVGRLDPAIIATAIQRGIMSDPFNLPDSGPLPEGKVPPFPTSSLDPIAEAQAHGIDKDRLFVERGIVGLPLALVEAAQATFREIITEDDFQRAVREGNTRNEWGPAALEVARQILTAHDYAELQLRGYLTADQRRAYTAQHGMTDANSDLLYDVLGRGINVHQMLIGQRRGGVYEGDTAQIPLAFLNALERGNLRPEYYNLAYAGRETYPSYFVVRALAQAGVITQERTKELFEGLGWPLDVAEAAAAFYAPSAAKAADPHVTKADTQLWNTLHKSYIAEEAGKSDVTQGFALLAIPPAAQTEILALWDAERSLIRKQLTPAQIRKALGDGVTNPATGAPWTMQDATQALLDRGYDQADATVFLQTT